MRMHDLDSTVTLVQTTLGVTIYGDPFAIKK